MLFRSTFDTTSNTLSVANAVTASGNLTAANLLTGGTITAYGNANVGNLLSLGDINAISNISGFNYFGSGNLQMVGNGSFANISVAGDAGITGNASTGNLSVNENLIVLQDSTFYGNFFTVTLQNNMTVSGVYANYDINRLQVGSAGGGVFLYSNGYIQGNNLLIS